MENEFVLNSETYYSKEADERYMSTHQFLDFCGYMKVRGCESRAMAKLKGIYSEPPTKPMIMGSFCDSFFEGTLEKFKEEHPEVFLSKGANKGELKADYKLCEKMIERCLKDELFMKYMSGEKQVIMTAPMFGCEWKIKMDSYIPGVAIVDFKTSSNIHDVWKIADYGYVDFTEAWGYTIQLAIYRKVVEINTGKKLPCYIAAVTKEEYPDIEVIYLDDQVLNHALNYVQMNIDSVLAVKNGESEPIRCGYCNYCKQTKVLMKPINHSDLIMEQ